MRTLTSAVKADICTQTEESLVKQWTAGITGRSIHEINKKPTKDVLQELRPITRPESSVIFHARTGKLNYETISTRPTGENGW
ncbi:hypothetical protein MMC07_000241 [Pseudocyphellaria aurata]|nr:hypothetical protein [Pseudocyphellaria aurata]